MAKARVTLTFEYEMNEENYPDCETVADMCAVDQANAVDIVFFRLEGDEEYDLKIEPVE